MSHIITSSRLFQCKFSHKLILKVKSQVGEKKRVYQVERMPLHNKEGTSKFLFIQEHRDEKNTFFLFLLSSLALRFYV